MPSEPTKAAGETQDVPRKADPSQLWLSPQIETWLSISWKIFSSSIMTPNTTNHPHIKLPPPKKNKAKLFFPRCSDQLLDAWGHAASWCDGLKHNRHLCIRLMAPKHSPPGGTFAHVPLPEAHEKHRGLPAWSLLFDLPFEPPFGLWPLLRFLNSSLSSASLFFFANLLSRFASLFLLTSGSFSNVSAERDPGNTERTADSAATTGAPLPPAAIHAAAGICTFSFQKVTSFVSSTRTHDHGAPGSQSLGICLPSDWSKSMVLLILAIFSALAWSSADATSPQAAGHWRTNFSMCRAYVSKELRVATFSIRHAVLKTLQLAIHAWKDAGPGRSFWRNDPSPRGVNILNRCALDIFLSNGNHTPKSQYGGWSLMKTLLKRAANWFGDGSSASSAWAPIIAT